MESNTKYTAFEAENLMLKAELERISVKMENVWQPWRVSALQQDKTNKTNQIIANTNAMVELAKIAPEFEPFTKTWFAHAKGEVAIGTFVGVSVTAVGRLWGLPSIQARMTGLTVAFMRVMYGMDGKRK